MVLGLLLPLLPVPSAAGQRSLTPLESRRLVLAAKPSEARDHAVTIELDHEHNGCAVWHLYVPGGSVPEFNTATLDWLSVDLRTGEVWNFQNGRIANVRVERMQRELRKRLGVSDAEVSAAIAKPCETR